MEPVGALAVVVILATLTLKAVEQIRRFFPSLENGWVIMVAWGVGSVLAALTGTAATADLFASWGLTLTTTPPLFLDYLVTGIIVAVSAGVFADMTGRSGNDSDLDTPVPVVITHSESDPYTPRN